MCLLGSMQLLSRSVLCRNITLSIEALKLHVVDLSFYIRFRCSGAVYKCLILLFSQYIHFCSWFYHLNIINVFLGVLLNINSFKIHNRHCIPAYSPNKILIGVHHSI